MGFHHNPNSTEISFHYYWIRDIDIAIKSTQAMTAQMSSHMQKYTSISIAKYGNEQNEIFVEFKLQKLQTKMLLKRAPGMATHVPLRLVAAILNV